MEEEQNEPERDVETESVGSFVYTNYKPRNFLDFKDTVQYLQRSEVTCQKYHYTVDGAIQNMESYCAMLRLSEDG